MKIVEFTNIEALEKILQEDDNFALNASKLKKEVLAETIKSLLLFGSKLVKLKLGLDEYETFDIRDIDFPKIFPHLEDLELKRMILNESVLKLEKIKRLKLVECRLITNEEVLIDSEDTLEELSFDDTNLVFNENENPKKLIIESKNLRKLFYSLDEDYSEYLPENIQLISCTNLDEIYLHISGEWTLSMTGSFPLLKKMSASSQRYGNHKIELDKIDDKSSEFLLNLRDYKALLANEKIYFLGDFEDFQKLTYLSKFLGAKVLTKPSSEMTMCVVNDEAYEAYEIDEPNDEIHAIIKLNKSVEIYSHCYFSTDFIYDWY